MYQVQRKAPTLEIQGYVRKSQLHVLGPGSRFMTFAAEGGKVLSELLVSNGYTHFWKIAIKHLRKETLTTH